MDVLYPRCAGLDVHKDRGVAGVRLAATGGAQTEVRRFDTTTPAQFQRLRHRRGPKKAICAVAASILAAGYHMLRDGTLYHDLGANHFNRTSAHARANRLVRQIAHPGFNCVLTPSAAESVSV